MMGGQRYKNYLSDKMEKEKETSIADISHPDEVVKVAELLYMKWYEKNLLPFDYVDKYDFITHFKEEYVKYWEEKND